MKASNQDKLFDEYPEKKQGLVECLGMTFPNDEARRAYFTELLREKLRDPEFRKIEGFPIGEDEDILRLSDPPYYTACPNPFLTEVLAVWQKERQTARRSLRLPEQAEQREPYAADVSEGKNDPIYNAHSYHTKVPHKAIMRYILHYTESSDIVFDGFCGTGMTGVAAQLCCDRKEVETLGFQVDQHEAIWDGKKAISHLGARKAVLNDLSPAAAFIAYNYNSPVDAAAFERDENRILRDVEKECGWMYETWHPNYSATNRVKGKINYVVWADVFICPHCGFESNFWDVAVDKNTWQVVDNWKCPKCSILLSKEGQKDGGAIKAERAWETYFDTYLGQTLRRVKQEPAFINYIVGKKRYNKLPDIKDKELVEKIENTPIPYQIPLTKLPLGDKTGDPKNVGVTHAHHFYTKRNLYVLSSFANRLGSPNKYIDIISIASIITKMYRFRSQNSSLGAGGGPLSGTLYIPSLSKEIPILKSLKEHISKSHKVIKKLSKLSNNLINTGSHTTIISIPSNSVDYIFTDPPFGSNLMYSELNFLWESWLRVFTSNKSEAIINNTQKKKLQDYQILMSMSFTEAFRILKPDHWITVEFHNSKNTVWNAIQEALLQAGFVIADVRVFDKRQGSYNQVNSTGAVKQDLIISAYKPNSTLEERALLKDGSEESAWIFIHDHLNKLPTLNEVNGQLIVNAERQSFLLFDRMVAFHVQRGILVPMSSGEFYAGLSHRYPERDGMYFLPGQVGEYDQARLQVQQVQQLQLFVTDESTAILWLRQQLESYPQSYQDLFPKFIRETNVWEKHEKSLELSEILEQNFLSYEGGGPIPEQIWEWMLRDDEMRDAVKGQNRENASNHVQTLAKGRWFVPDPNNSKQLEKIRERALLKEFEGYKVYPGNKLKVFRIEAVRAGFRKAWQERDYKIIIAVAEKISEEALQQDPKLLMWYDQALTRLEQ